MGLVYENITLKNATDVGNSVRGIIQEGEVRQIKVLAMVDTGAETLVINEAMRQELGLTVIGERRVGLANNYGEMCQFTEPVMIYWKDRPAVTHAIVLPGATEVLLGAIPLEEMNVMIDPRSQQLVGIHGDEIIYKVK
ncbi:MAG: aspartyl protease family protein [Treponema sp.]|nr:aspartyl protease family protein [Treponema sp.]